MSKKSKKEYRTIEYRTIELVGLDTTNLELEKVTQINNQNTDKIKNFIYFDELPNGKWRMCYTTKVIPDITQLQSLTILRKEEKHTSS